MTVETTLALPAQPTTGTMQYVPLGGDGLTSPHAAYMLRSVQIAGDSSSGQAIIKVAFDRRWTTLVQFVTGQVSGVAAPVAFQFIISGELMPSVIDKGTDSFDTVGIQPSAGHTWFPPPVLVPGGADGELKLTWLNVDGDTFFCDSLIYLFNIDVRQKTPIAPLLWARGG